MYCDFGEHTYTYVYNIYCIQSRTKVFTDPRVQAYAKYSTHVHYYTRTKSLCDIII